MRGILITILAATMLAVGCTQTSKDTGKETSAPGSSDSGQRTTANSTRSGPKAQGACDVLTASDIAGILKVAQVTKHYDTGKNEFTKVDFCSWYIGKLDPEGDLIRVTLRRAESADEGDLLSLFSAAKSDLINSGLVGAQPISGVGDEATYTPYTDGSGGGAIAMRAGTTAVSIRGPLSKDALISMAKLAANKL